MIDKKELLKRMFDCHFICDKALREYEEKSQEEIKKMKENIVLIDDIIDFINKNPEPI